jgi:hypothetical protein
MLQRKIGMPRLVKVGLLEQIVLQNNENYKNLTRSTSQKVTKTSLEDLSIFILQRELWR